MKTLFRILILVFIVFTSCERGGSGYKYETGAFPDVPVNMGEINSGYDDYNSTSPVIGTTSPLCFSSNRGSLGKDFNILYKLLDVWMDKSSGKLTVAENTSGNLDVFTQNLNLYNALTQINTSSNEFGPYLIPQNKNYNYEGRNSSFIFLYSNNESGSQDIKFVHNLDGEYYNDPKPVAILNTDKDDAYPSISADFSTLYFCSNREGNFDIYDVALDTTISVLSNLEDPISKPVFKNFVLSSDSADKCPFIYKNMMVFTSNRSGGFGGNDLYYALYENGQWLQPINFGSKINTQYDEYRPIVKPMAEFTNDFMIFSSNRPGGKGGFDLYYVGVQKKF